MATSDAGNLSNMNCHQPPKLTRDDSNNLELQTSSPQRKKRAPWTPKHRNSKPQSGETTVLEQTQAINGSSYMPAPLQSSPKFLEASPAQKSLNRKSRNNKWPTRAERANNRSTPLQPGNSPASVPISVSSLTIQQESDYQALSNTPRSLRPFSNYIGMSTIGKQGRLPPGVTFAQGPIWGVWAANMYTSNFNTFCKEFSTVWGCPRGETCPMLHDKDLRNATFKYRRDKAIEKQNLKSALEPSKVSVQKTPKRHESKSSMDSADAHDAAYFQPSATSVSQSELPVLIPDISRCSITDHSKVTSTVTTLVDCAAAASANLPRLAPQSATKAWRTKWDKGELKIWAEKNISLETMTRVMVKYLDAGRVPFHLVDSPVRDGESFHYFPLLPGEIRNNIWRHAIKNESSQVMVRYDPVAKAISHRKPTAPLLRVNREARSLAEPHWHLKLQTKHSPAQIRIRFRSDRLFIHNASSSHLLPMIKSVVRNDRHSIYWLSIPLRDYIAQPADTILALCHCAKLQKVWFVIGEGIEDTNFIREFFQGMDGLGTKIQKALARTWKREWECKGLDWVQEKVPLVRFEFVHAFTAKHLKIDNLRWL